MNYTNIIARILNKPEQSFFEDDTVITEIVVKFYQVRNNTFGPILQLSVWGSLGDDVIKYFKINDYILIEGYISLREDLIKQSNNIQDKQIDLSVVKIYPFFFENCQKKK